MYSLTIETDDYFFVIHHGRIFTGYFSLLVVNHNELQIIKNNLRGPFGAATGGNYIDIKNWMQEIIDEKLNDFDIHGGNRTISWHYVSPIFKCSDYSAGYLDGLDKAIHSLERVKTQVLMDEDYSKE